MKIATVSSITAGISMLGAFTISLYIDLYDTTLAQEDPLHHEINWILGIISLITGIILIVRPRSVRYKIIAGVVWPFFYLLSLGFDVETRLCFGTEVHCWPSISDSYDYLILNQRVEGWVLSPYTTRFLIAFLLVAIVLAVVSIAFLLRTMRQERKKRPHSTSTEMPVKNSNSRYKGTTQVFRKPS